MIPALSIRHILSCFVVLYVLAVSGRPLLRGQGAALVDELEGLRQRLLGEDGYSKAQWTRKLAQTYTPYSSYGGYYGYGYYGYGYYGGYADPYAGMEGMTMRRRALLSNGEQSSSRNLLMTPYPMYGYGYGYYYGYYGPYGGYADPYAGMDMGDMAMGRRRMLGSLEHLSTMMMDDADGFVRPGDKSYLEDASNGRELKMATPYWQGSYGYYYGYYGYYGAYGGSYADPYAGMSGMDM